MPIFQILLMVLYLKLAGSVRRYFANGTSESKKKADKTTKGEEMDVKILGTGCANCKRLESLVREAASEAGLQPELEEVTEIPTIMSYGVMHTPGLVIDGVLKASGRVPAKAEIAAWLQTAAGASR